MDHPPPVLRILVVEDEPDIRELLVATLAAEGPAVVEGAVDGQEAMEKLAGGLAPSVILLDLRMPRLSGEGVLRALEQVPHPPPVVTMSACTRVGPPGSAAHLEKPFTIGEAMAALRRVAGEVGLALSPRLPAAGGRAV